MQSVIGSVKQQLIQRVRLADGVSRVELARRLNLAPSTVGVYVDRLIEEGYLLEGHKARKAAGRPPTILQLNPQAGEFVGVDFDARQMAATSVDFSQQVLRQEVSQIQSSDSADHVVQRIESAISAVVRPRRLLGIGVAVPGVIDAERGLARHYQYIRGWQDIPLVERLSRKFKVPVFLENNIRAMALAEQWFGLARGISHFICLGIRSGIGAGIVIHGRLHRGHDGLAGEIGGWPADSAEKSQRSGTRRRATLEEVASVKAILQQLAHAIQQGDSTQLTLKRHVVLLEDMLIAAKAGDPLVLQVLSRAARVVGKVIAKLSLLLNPEQVIIAGPLAELTDAFLRPLIEATNKRLEPVHARRPQIVASGFGHFGGALGAAALAVHQWSPVQD